MGMRRWIVVAVMAGPLSGCAINPGVAPIGPDTYSVTRQAATGFTGLGSLRVKALREANAFCAKERKIMQVIHTKDSQPPYILGNFPRTEIEFMCLDRSDPELSRPKPKRDPDTVIEVRKE